MKDLLTTLRGVLTIIAAILYVLSFAVCLTKGAGRLQMLFVLGLFLVPLVMSIAIWRKGFSRVTLVVLPLVPLYLLLLTYGYFLGGGQAGESTPPLSLLNAAQVLGAAVTLWIFATVILLIWYFLGKNDPNDPRSEIAAVLSLFLAFTLCSSLLLAFHHHQNPRSLRFAEAPPGKPSAQRNAEADAPSEVVEGADTAKDNQEAEPSQDQEPRRVWNVLFEESSIQVMAKPALTMNGNSCGNSLPSSFDLKTCKADFTCRGQGFKACFNEAELAQIVSAILSDGQGFQRLQVTLIGHANESRPVQLGTCGGFQSNFEFAEARIFQVRSAIEDRLRSSGPHNLEWVYIPVSSEDVASGGLGQLEQFLLNGSADKLALDRKLRVQVHLQPIEGHLYQAQWQRLAPAPEVAHPLLDYIYFMIYTVTTTGYGDVIPFGAVPKMITILGNLFEVITLIVLFGVVIGKCMSIPRT